MSVSANMNNLPGVFVEEFNRYFTKHDLNRFNGLYELLFDAIRNEDHNQTEKYNRQNVRVNYEGENPTEVHNHQLCGIRNLTLSKIMELAKLSVQNRNRTYHKILTFFEKSGFGHLVKITTLPKRGRYSKPCDIEFKSTFAFIFAFQTLEDEFSIQFRKLQAFITNCHVRISAIRQQKLIEQIRLLETRLERNNTKLIQKDEQVRFLKTNRYHKIAPTWLKDSNRIDHSKIFAYLNSQSKSLSDHLEWQGKVPYVKRGHEMSVRSNLLHNLPQQNQLEEYGFF